MKQQNTTRQKRIGLWAGLLMSVFNKNRQPTTDAELYKQDFHPNMQRMGLRFTERMRNIFRHRWLRHNRP